MTTEKNGDGRRWSNRPLVRERDDRLVRWLWGVLAGVVLALAPAGAYLVCQNECLQVVYQLNELAQKNEELTETARRLGVEQAVLETPPIIEAWAHEQPDLIHPEAPDVIVASTPEESPDSLLARSAAGPEVPPETRGPDLRSRAE